jgi:C1A family cysteine protease
MKLLDRFLIWLRIRKKVQPGIKFGWKRDLPDHRDYKFKVSMPVDLPPMIDLRAQCPPVYNQLDIGSCVGNGVAGVYQFEEMKQGKENFIPSRLFIYYNARALEGTISEDSGCSIRDGVKTAVNDGVCNETMWPYKTCKFKTKPTSDCYKAALDNQVLEYQRITPHNLYDVKQCLALGYPIICGISLYESFMTEETARTGIAKMPNPNESLVGGHCIVIVGYDDDNQSLIVRNSWGEGWGMKGYFFLPYGYLSEPNLSADYWTIRLVE